MSNKQISYPEFLYEVVYYPAEVHDLGTTKEPVTSALGGLPVTFLKSREK